MINLIHIMITITQMKLMKKFLINKNRNFKKIKCLLQAVKKLIIHRKRLKNNPVNKVA
jgi:hypothetical protein